MEVRLEELELEVVGAEEEVVVVGVGWVVEEELEEEEVEEWLDEEEVGLR